MALLAATRGTPERVWALAKHLDAHGGGAPRSALQQWLRPRWDGVIDVARHERDRLLVTEVFDAAGGLGLVERSAERVNLRIADLPADIIGFADLIHQLLRDQPEQSADADILDAFACAVVQTEVVGNRQWLSDWTSAQIADLFTRSLRPRDTEKDDQRYNTTRHASWMRWVEFVGLNLTLSARTTLLSVTDRLQRMLRAGDLPRDRELAPQELLAWIASTMPYLDGGTLFLAAANRMNYRPSTTVSRLLSAALRDLHEDGVITLTVPRGDAQLAARLAADPFADIRGFNAVTLNGAALDV